MWTGVHGGDWRRVIQRAGAVALDGVALSSMCAATSWGPTSHGDPVKPADERGMAVTMSKNEILSINPAVASVYGRNRDPDGFYSRPDPEEGYRLMRSFLTIRQPALRQAIVELVAQLSTLGDQRQ